MYGAENGRKTVLDLLLNPEDGYAALSKQSIVDETYSFCFAGTHTTSFTISLATYYLLRSPDKLAKLREELKTVEDKRNPEGLLEYRDVYKLPYLVSTPFSHQLPKLASLWRVIMLTLLCPDRHHQRVSPPLIPRSRHPPTCCPSFRPNVGWLLLAS